MNLRNKTIRLAYTNKELRPVLLPLIVASDEDEKESRYDEGDMTEAEKAKLFKDNPEFREEHYKHKDQFTKKK